MFCSHCGQKITDAYQKFCTSCGNVLSSPVNTGERLEEGTDPFSQPYAQSNTSGGYALTPKINLNDKQIIITVLAGMLIVVVVAIILVFIYSGGMPGRGGYQDYSSLIDDYFTIVTTTFNQNQIYEMFLPEMRVFWDNNNDFGDRTDFLIWTDGFSGEMYVHYLNEGIQSASWDITDVTILTDSADMRDYFQLVGVDLQQIQQIVAVIYRVEVNQIHSLGVAFLLCQIRGNWYLMQTR